MNSTLVKINTWLNKGKHQWYRSEYKKWQNKSLSYLCVTGGILVILAFCLLLFAPNHSIGDSNNFWIRLLDFIGILSIIVTMMLIASIETLWRVDSYERKRAGK